MSITRDHGAIVYECDHCGETFESEETDFDLAMNKARDEGWVARRDATGWHHFDLLSCRLSYEEDQKK